MFVTKMPVGGEIVFPDLGIKIEIKSFCRLSVGLAISTAGLLSFDVSVASGRSIKFSGLASCIEIQVKSAGPQNARIAINAPKTIAFETTNRRNGDIIQTAIDAANEINNRNDFDEYLLSGNKMKQIHEQTVNEICRLCLLETDEASNEVAQCFNDLTQIETLYVAAKCSVQLGEGHCDLLSVAVSGRAAYSIETQSIPLLKSYDRGGVDELIRYLSGSERIAGITLIPFCHKLRGIGGAIADRLVSISNGQIEEVA